MAAIRDRTRPAAPILGLLGVVLLACGEPPPAAADEATRRFELAIDHVGARPVDGEVLPEAEVRRELLAAASGLPSFVDPTRISAPALRARIDLGEVDSAAGGRILRVDLVATVPSGAQAVLGGELDAIIELERHDGTLSAAEDVPVALGRAAAVLDAKVQLATGATVEARRLLTHEDPEIVVLALEHVARKRWRGLADDVAALLPAGDERIAAAAIEALGAIGGPEHAAVLLKHARLADRDQAQRLYDALASLGGDQAQGFLEFAARNEDDPTLAEVASRALGRLRSGPAAFPEPGPEPAATSADPARGLRGHRP